MHRVSSNNIGDCFGGETNREKDLPTRECSTMRWHDSATSSSRTIKDSPLSTRPAITTISLAPVEFVVDVASLARAAPRGVLSIPQVKICAIVQVQSRNQCLAKPWRAMILTGRQSMINSRRRITLRSRFTGKALIILTSCPHQGFSLHPPLSRKKNRRRRKKKILLTRNLLCYRRENTSPVL